jgi:hypothetical protein
MSFAVELPTMVKCVDGRRFQSRLSWSGGCGAGAGAWALGSAAGFEAATRGSVKMKAIATPAAARIVTRQLPSLMGSPRLVLSIYSGGDEES